MRPAPNCCCCCCLQPCLTWEPLLAPAITPHLSPASASHLSVDFNTTASDMWLQLLLLAAAAVPVLQSALRAQQEQIANAKLMRAAAGEASDNEEDPLGLGLGNEDRISSVSSVSDSNTDGSSGGGSASDASQSSSSSVGEALAKLGPRALRVGGVDMRAAKAKKEERARQREMKYSECAARRVRGMVRK